MRQVRRENAHIKYPPARQRIGSAALLVGVVAITVVVHWPALRAKAICFDDRQYIHDNRLVKNPSWTSAMAFLTELTHPSTVTGYYQPLAMVALMLDTAAGGGPDHVQPYHRTSIALHAMNTALATLLLVMLFESPLSATIVGLLFGLHPLTVEPVAWLGERKTLLATFFSYLCLCLYVKGKVSRGESSLPEMTRHRGRTIGLSYAASLLCFLGALMSKPTSTLLPLAMLLMDIWPLRRFSRQALFEKLPFFGLAAISAAVTYHSQSNTAQAILPSQQSLIGVVLTICYQLAWYPLNIVWPTGLMPHYDFPTPTSLRNPEILLSVLFNAAMLIALFASRRRTDAWFFGWLLFFVLIFPTTGVIGFTNVVASDKFFYLPAIGLMLPLTFTLGRWKRDAALAGQSTRIALSSIAFILLLSAEAWATRLQYDKWRDSMTLFEYMVERSPNSGYIRDGYGSVLADSGRLSEAAVQYADAVRRMPESASTKNNLGTVLRAQGRLDEAIDQYREAIRLRPRYLSPRINLANALRQQRELDGAIREYSAVLDIEPWNFPACLFLGTAFLEKLDYATAERQLRRAVQLDRSSADAHHFLGMALEGLGRFEDAAAAYQEALRRRPGDATIAARVARLRQAGNAPD